MFAGLGGVGDGDGVGLGLGEGVGVGVGPVSGHPEPDVVRHGYLP